MSPAAVRFHPAAAQEAEEAYDWYAARNPAEARGFREELRRAVDAVAEHPGTWPAYRSRARRYVFPRFPFSVVYVLRGRKSKSSPWAGAGLMDRRLFIGGLVLAPVVAPRVVRAQPARKVYRIGLLGSSVDTSDIAGPQPRNPGINALLRGLRELGYVYGEHFVTEARGAEGKAERFPALAADLIGTQVDLIVAAGPPLPALKQTTSTIPVVMVGAADPVRQGLIRSLAHPGGNFTGLSLQLTETTGKRLELLKEVVPGPAPAAVLWDRLAASSRAPWEMAQSAARQRGWKLLSLDVREFTGKIEDAFKAATHGRAGALLVHPVALFDRNAGRIAKLAAASRLPAMYGLRLYVEAGGLLSYSADINDMFLRAAVFVDKILRGASPADLPVEQPTKFELLVNLKAARALAFTVPQSLLSRADEVLQ